MKFHVVVVLRRQRKVQKKKSAKHLYRKLLLKFPIDKHQSVILDCIYVQGYRLT